MYLNCDLGESKSAWERGTDKDLLKLVDMLNISCGAHAGDEILIRETIRLGVQQKKTIGAHPSYPDRANFGRVSLNLTENQLLSEITNQLHSFKEWVKDAGGSVSYIKPHGALYHDCLKNLEIYEVVKRASESVFGRIPLLLMYAPNPNEKIIREAFTDRKYLNEHTLVSRLMDGASITNADDALNQYILISDHQKVFCLDGSEVEIKADALCIHSDTPSALEIAQKITKYRSNKAD